jgi:hypothetical protein
MSRSPARRTRKTAKAKAKTRRSWPGVHFSTSSRTGSDGLLGTVGFGDEGEGLVDVTPVVELPELSLEDHVYAGYLTKIGFSTASDLTGATFVLQRITKGAWTEIESAPAEASGEVSFFTKLAAGKTRLRVLITAPGFELGLEPQKLTVREPGGSSSVDGSDDGLDEPLRWP